jgi:hypothetical protein
LPTSTVVPFGIRVRTSPSVPGDFRKFVSAVRVTGLAIAPTADERVTMAANAAIRTKLMAVLFFLPSRRRPRRHLTPAVISNSRSRIQKQAVRIGFEKPSGRQIQFCCRDQSAAST